MSSVLQQLKNNYIFAVIRGKSSDDAIEISKHSVLGGIKNIEVTYTTPEASKAITELKALYAKKSEIKKIPFLHVLHWNLIQWRRRASLA